MEPEFGALIKCNDCPYECNISPYHTVAEAKFHAARQAKACGCTIKSFEAYVKESKRIVRILQAVL